MSFLPFDYSQYEDNSFFYYLDASNEPRLSLQEIAMLQPINDYYPNEPMDSRVLLVEENSTIAQPSMELMDPRALLVQENSSMVQPSMELMDSRTFLVQENPLVAHEPSMELMDSRAFSVIENSAIAQPSMELRGMDSRMFVDDQEMAQPSEKKKGLAGSRPISRTRERNNRIRERKRLQVSEKIMVAQQSADEEGSIAKKLDHNAKERVRRMKLNASYLALRSLLPNSRRSKKRWSAPLIIDKVLEYIPEMESEIENLTLKKNNIVQSETETNQLPKSELQSPTVSINEVGHGELIIQICMGIDKENAFSTLIQNAEEEEGLCIVSASTLHVCDDRVSYHLHIQTKENSLGADYISELKDKLVSWLHCSTHMIQP